MGTAFSNASSDKSPPLWIPGDFGLEQCITTHVSEVFIGQAEVLKRKRKVKFEFVDHTSLAARSHSCFEEIRLNRRLTKDVYKGVYFIIGGEEDCKLSKLYQSEVTPPENAVDAVVCMRRLANQDTLFSRLTQMSNEELRKGFSLTAQTIATFHQQLSAVEDTCVAAFLSAARANIEALKDRPEFSTAIESLVLAVSKLQENAIEHLSTLLDEREEQGFFCDAHGDIRLEHVYWKPEQQETEIQIIDCIEFSSKLRRADVLDDMSFLAMDLDFQRRSDLSRYLVEEYQKAYPQSWQEDLLTLYKAYRALVRAKIESLQGVENPQHLAYARRFIGLAHRYFLFGQKTPCLMVSGPIGVGKSTIARQLAESIDALYLSSDEIRNELFGETEASAKLGFAAGRYQSSQRMKVYEEMATRTQRALCQGVPVVNDATFSKEIYRKPFERFEKDPQLVFCNICCKAEESVLRQRLQKRAKEKGSSSDGREEILAEILAEFEWPTDALCLDLAKDQSVVSICRAISTMHGMCCSQEE